MGQNEHQARGAMMTPKRMATAVVRRHIVTKTMPTLSTTPSVCTILKTMNPMRMMKMGTLIHMLRRIEGICNLRLKGPSQKSTKLPLGQRLPQNHLPRKGAIIIRVAKTSKRKKPNLG
jgi:hypothetical protein